MLQGLLRGVLYLLLLLAFYQGVVAASDSEIIEAETTNPSLSATSHYVPVPVPVPVSVPVLELPKWHPNDTVLVRPYNILEASCPPGYVLVNKHCHKRVRGSTTIQ